MGKNPTSAAARAVLRSEAGRLRDLDDASAAKAITKLAAKRKPARKARDAECGQVHEGTKTVLLLKGCQCSAQGTALLRNLKLLRHQSSKFVDGHRNEKLQHLLDSNEELLFQANHNSASVVVAAASAKKKPLRLLLFRTFDRAFYDKHVLEVLHFAPISAPAPRLPVAGSKPLLFFLGNEWEGLSSEGALQNALADLFGGVCAHRLHFDGIDNCVFCTAFTEDVQVKVRVTQYFVLLKKAPESAADAAAPAVELAPTGFALLLKPLLSVAPDRALAKAATRIPAELFSKGKSQRSTSDLRETKLRVHAYTEDLDKLYLRHTH